VVGRTDTQYPQDLLEATSRRKSLFPRRRTKLRNKTQRASKIGRLLQGTSTPIMIAVQRRPCQDHGHIGINGLMMRSSIVRPSDSSRGRHITWDCSHCPTDHRLSPSQHQCPQRVVSTNLCFAGVHIVNFDLIRFIHLEIPYHISSFSLESCTFHLICLEKRK
jgi:hypothetical protein